MTGPDDRHAAKTRSTPAQDADPKTGRLESALERAISELIALPQEELLSRLDLKQAGDNIAKFFECDLNVYCRDYLHTIDDIYNPEDVESDMPVEYARTGNNHAPPAADILNFHIMELCGSIKWFDVSKGYGFIVPDNRVLPDILLLITCLRAGGYHTAHEGARIRCEVLLKPKILQAFRVLELDDSTAIHPALLQHKTPTDVQPESDWMTATIKWFNRVRGFGFAQTASGSDVLIHMETLRRFGFTELRPGQRVELRWGHGPKGATAAALRPAGSVPAPGRD